MNINIFSNIPAVSTRNSLKKLTEKLNLQEIFFLLNYKEFQQKTVKNAGKIFFSNYFFI